MLLADTCVLSRENAQMHIYIRKNQIVTGQPVWPLGLLNLNARCRNFPSISSALVLALHVSMDCVILMCREKVIALTPLVEHEHGRQMLLMPVDDELQQQQHTGQMQLKCSTW